MFRFICVAISDRVNKTEFNSLDFRGNSLTIEASTKLKRHDEEKCIFFG